MMIINNEYWYQQTWVLLMYFLSIVFSAHGVIYNVQTNIYYGLFLLNVGLLFNISVKLNYLMNKDKVMDNFYEDSD